MTPDASAPERDHPSTVFASRGSLLAVTASFKPQKNKPVVQMFKSIIMRQLLIAAICATLAGCGSPKPVAYNGIESSSYLRPNPEDDSGNVPYSYSARVNWRAYANVMIEQVAIYQGPDHQFNDLPENDKASLASYMHDQFVEKLATRFHVTNTPGPNTLRIKLTLTGVTKSTPILGTLSKFDLMGGLYNGVQSVRGGEGTFTGAVIYAVEIYDASTAQLLCAYIAKQYPNSLNIGATFGALAAARTGIEKGAEKMVEQLR
jgi:hypothetical protein